MELSKCSYHVVVLKFSLQGAPIFVNMKSELPMILVNDPHTGQEQVLGYLHPYAAHKTLGHYKEPSGIQVEQFKRSKEKSDSITEFLWKMPLTRSEAWTYYLACYLPSVTYPLTASALTPKQLTKIQTKACLSSCPVAGIIDTLIERSFMVPNASAAQVFVISQSSKAFYKSRTSYATFENNLKWASCLCVR